MRRKLATAVVLVAGVGVAVAGFAGIAVDHEALSALEAEFAALFGLAKHLDEEVAQ